MLPCMLPLLAVASLAAAAPLSETKRGLIPGLNFGLTGLTPTPISSDPSNSIPIPYPVESPALLSPTGDSPATPLHRRQDSANPLGVALPISDVTELIGGSLKRDMPSDTSVGARQLDDIVAPVTGLLGGVAKRSVPDVEVVTGVHGLGHVDDVLAQTLDSGALPSTSAVWARQLGGLTSLLGALPISDLGARQVGELTSDVISTVADGLKRDLGVTAEVHGISEVDDDAARQLDTALPTTSALGARQLSDITGLLGALPISDLGARQVGELTTDIISAAASALKARDSAVPGLDVVPAIPIAPVPVLDSRQLPALPEIDDLPVPVDLGRQLPPVPVVGDLPIPDVAGSFKRQLSTGLPIVGDLPISGLTGGLKRQLSGLPIVGDLPISDLTGGLKRQLPPLPVVGALPIPDLSLPGGLKRQLSTGLPIVGDLPISGLTDGLKRQLSGLPIVGDLPVSDLTGGLKRQLPPLPVVGALPVPDLSLPGGLKRQLSGLPIVGDLPLSGLTGGIKRQESNPPPAPAAGADSGELAGLDDLSSSLDSLDNLNRLGDVGGAMKRASDASDTAFGPGPAAVPASAEEMAEACAYAKTMMSIVSALSQAGGESVQTPELPAMCQ